MIYSKTLSTVGCSKAGKQHLQIKSVYYYLQTNKNYIYLFVYTLD